MKIKMLNNETINKIAAGEVIIRPVSVVKELVENAIDAGAGQIAVMIEAGGKQQLIIRDNGCGIAYNEIPLAFKRHATSKLTTIDDLETVHSLGFRGEALSSVAAVARVQVTTRNEHEEVGSLTTFEGGVLINQRVCSYNQGTQIKVWDLFYNTPARRKHLEKDKKEEGLIRDLMNKMALSHPEIAFQVKANGRLVLETPGSGKVSDVVNVLYGWETAGNLITLDYENSPMKLSGYIGNLKLMRGDRDDQIFFINGRYVKNAQLAQALDEAYAGYLMKHQHPFGIVFIELPGRMLDINIHPAKTEIKILNQSLISLLFKQGIRETLRGSNLVVDIAAQNALSADAVAVKKCDEAIDKEINECSKNSAPASIEAQKQEMFLSPQSMIHQSEKSAAKIGTPTEKPRPGGRANSVQAGAVSVPQAAATLATTDRQPAVMMTAPQQAASVRETTKTFNVDEKKPLRQPVDRPDFVKMKIVGQLFNGYILLEGIGEIYLIDQHAAHEAFLTQELEEIFRKGDFIPSQGLMTPITVKIRPKDLDGVRNALEYYQQIGYECDVFGADSLLVRSVPVLLGEPQSIELLESAIAENLFADDLPAENVISTELTNKLISMACKAAIKGGQALTGEEIRQLLANLMTLDNPFTCPHGRPIITRLREYELMKLFKRVI